MRYRTAPSAHIPATVETVEAPPHPYMPGKWAALVHRQDDTPAPRFNVFEADTEAQAADIASAWLGSALLAVVEDPRHSQRVL